MLNRPLLEGLYRDLRGILATRGTEMPPPAEPADLLAFETAFGIRLPGSYRYFLSQQDGWFGEFWQGFMLPGVRAWLAEDTPAKVKLDLFLAYAGPRIAQDALVPLGFGVDDGRMLFFILDPQAQDGEFPVVMLGPGGELQDKWASFPAFLEAAAMAD